MIPLIRETIRDFLYNKEFARARLRSGVLFLGTVASTAASQGWLSGLSIDSGWSVPILGLFASAAAGIGQGDRTKNVLAEMKQD